MPQNIPLGVLLTLLTTVIFALAATLQHAAVGDTSDAPEEKEQLSGGQLKSLLTSPRWWLGMSLTGLGALVSSAALLLAPVTVVQPLAILAVPWTVLMASRLQRYRVSPAMWTAVAVAVGGTLWFAVVAVLFAAVREDLDDSRLITGAVVGFLVSGAFALVGARGPQSWRCFAWAAAGAVIYGLESGMVKAIFEYVATRDWTRSATFWTLVVLVAVGAVVATVFMQQGYATGAAEIVVGATNAVGPISAVAFGIAVLGEGANITAPAGVMMAAAAALAVYGVVLLSRSHPATVAAAPAPTPATREG